MPRSRLTGGPQQVRAAALLAVPVLLAATLWVVALATADPPAADGRTAASRPDPAPDADGSDPAAVGTATDEPGEPDPDDGREPTSDEPVTVTFDDVCEVDVEPTRDRADLRPWQFPECDRAPIALRGEQTRWIVVIASMWGEDFTEDDAAERLEATRAADHLLWSSHYPSLNPGLWVVVAGPFATEADAEADADRLGAGPYARELSDDIGDRYCNADDGCTGETRPDEVRRRG